MGVHGCEQKGEAGSPTGGAPAAPANECAPRAGPVPVPQPLRLSRARLHTHLHWLFNAERGPALCKLPAGTEGSRTFISSYSAGICALSCPGLVQVETPL